MLKRPSSRRKSKQEQIQLNLVPVLDTMVTLIAFLLFTMSFLSIVTVESPLPVVNPQDVEEKLKERPLQLTVTIRQDNTEIWSPFEKIAPKAIPNFAPGQPDLRAVHEALIAIKQQFPNENQIVMVPAGGITYDVLVAAMDSVRVIEKTDPPIFVKDVAGNDVPLKMLFPQVVFGNLLGDI